MTQSLQTEAINHSEISLLSSAAIFFHFQVDEKDQSYGYEFVRIVWLPTPPAFSLNKHYVQGGHYCILQI